MHIAEVTDDKKQYMGLLLLADEEERMIAVIWTEGRCAPCGTAA